MSESPASDAWYSYEGPENDVVLSTRVRLARNLANYPFPGNFRGDDARQVQTLVFDSVANSGQAEHFQALPAIALDSLGARIMTERGVIPADMVKAPGGGIVMRNDGKVCCTVNGSDHVHIIAFAPGLSCDTAFNECSLMDSQLQERLQFAASYDYGFLTSSLKDCGSGLRISVRLHLPSLSFTGRMGEFSQDLAKKGLELSACYGAGSESGSSLGSYYQLATGYAAQGSELDQTAGLLSAVETVINAERRARAKLVKEHVTKVQDAVYRSYARSRFALLMSLREAVETVSGLKWGADLGLLHGISYSTLHALLYRVQEGHLQFVLKNGLFTFPKDIAADSSLQIQRLRSLILQEALENVKLGD